MTLPPIACEYEFGPVTPRLPRASVAAHGCHGMQAHVLAPFHGIRSRPFPVWPDFPISDSLAFLLLPYLSLRLAVKSRGQLVTILPPTTVFPRGGIGVGGRRQRQSCPLLCGWDPIEFWWSCQVTKGLELRN